MLGPVESLNAAMAATIAAFVLRDGPNQAEALNCIVKLCFE